MENPPDLIVVFTADDQHHEKKKTPSEDVQIANEFTEQLCLLKQRFHEQIQSIDHQQTQLIQQTANELNQHMNNILRKNIDDIEGLRFVFSFLQSFPYSILFRLLHQKELCMYSKNISDCIEHQSCEMHQLCHYLIGQENHSWDYLNQLQDDFHRQLNELKKSFDSKMNYLNDLHCSTMEKIQEKYQVELNELQCELNLRCV